MRIRFLGTHSAESKTTGLVSFLIDDYLAVEAGSLSSELSFEEQKLIKATLLTHAHYDHIRGIPSLAFNNLNGMTSVYAIQPTLETLSSHLVDGIIYPDFTQDTSFVGKVTLELIAIEPFKTYGIAGYDVLALPVRHSLPAVGFQIAAADGKSVFYTGDTGPGLSSLWDHIAPDLIIIDLTFPDRLRDLAINAGHLCPSLLKKELMEFREKKQYYPEIVTIHLNPVFESEIKHELSSLSDELQLPIGIACEGDSLLL